MSKKSNSSDGLVKRRYTTHHTGRLTMSLLKEGQLSTLMYWFRKWLGLVGGQVIQIATECLRKKDISVQMTRTGTTHMLFKQAARSLLPKRGLDCVSQRLLEFMRCDSLFALFTLQDTPSWGDLDDFCRRFEFLLSYITSIAGPVHRTTKIDIRELMAQRAGPHEEGVMLQTLLNMMGFYAAFIQSGLLRIGMFTKRFSGFLAFGYSALAALALSSVESYDNLVRNTILACCMASLLTRCKNTLSEESYTFPHYPHELSNGAHCKASHVMHVHNLGIPSLEQILKTCYEDLVISSIFTTRSCYITGSPARLCQLSQHLEQLSKLGVWVGTRFVEARYPLWGNLPFNQRLYTMTQEAWSKSSLRLPESPANIPVFSPINGIKLRNAHSDILAVLVTGTQAGTEVKLPTGSRVLSFELLEGHRYLSGIPLMINQILQQNDNVRILSQPHGVEYSPESDVHPCNLIGRHTRARIFYQMAVTTTALNNLGVEARIGVCLLSPWWDIGIMPRYAYRRMTISRVVPKSITFVNELNNVSGLNFPKDILIRCPDVMSFFEYWCIQEELNSKSEIFRSPLPQEVPDSRQAIANAIRKIPNKEKQSICQKIFMTCNPDVKNLSIGK